MFYGGLWSGNFHPALHQLGHEVVESRVDLLPASRFMDVAGSFTPQEQAARGDITQRILDELFAVHARTPVDLFLSYFYNSHFDPAAFEEIHRRGIVTINFFCNSVHQFELVSAIAAKSQFSWHAERDTRARYIAAGARPVWVQMAADPELYGPRPEEAKKASACFVGQQYADRDEWMASLIRAGVPVDIYGTGWKQDSASPGRQNAAAHEWIGGKTAASGGFTSHLKIVKKHVLQHGIIRGLQRTWRQVRQRSRSRKLLPLFAAYSHGFLPGALSTTFARHEVILNFSNVWADGRPGAKLIPHVRLRDFEAPMCRTCYLTGHTDEITEFYEVGREIDTYTTESELVDKTRHYLKHPEAAERLREAGWQRAKRDHTWVRRFEELFRKTGLRN